MSTRLTPGDMVMILHDDCTSMTDWELAFIVDIVAKIEADQTFTRKQLDRIEHIYMEHMT